jgi:hypothetical protein
MNLLGNGNSDWGSFWVVKIASFGVIAMYISYNKT